MSGPLAPHPVGIKFWTSIWRDNKDLPYNQIHAKFQNWYGHSFHRTFGKYFYQHRAGPLGAFAPIVIFSVGFKIVTMYYGTLRDTNAAVDAANAYGQGGYKTNPVPK
ncbi:unnamed protein product [Polarella glacialis]|uniref:Uncharacterized protein n=1 Tax=Polarella glacialis TaxID=89957 RepID=A0A813ITS3_POLGL|nr:unnamed protein product [Polarella glacialis]CAE8656724.1 unnamed protein product [Polarella glacialis]|mmetsp:Transcript_65306/g.105526  ORF Transcript_65306/g.105526 Transcript_65306/m.105526 type:complete len:107 (+) Transcript_65306:71-391(+)|eukprot:CAMPEP_0115085136 /NCGR_PEP_ID=MMETSP0227-20121206/21739_1 /TAXON_ID=89957 /ORGANISM="Polarella glacialis, Strain CCMP 1383" /LENGTH=106 /DNA_ID=CAMNT_0002474203 /DNA_START=65 /DNA_END=385 /DNA_ORIENTATION=+